MRSVQTELRKTFLVALVAAALAGMPAAAQTSSDTCKGSTVDLQGEDIAQKSRAFLSELQAAVGKGEKANVAAMISYPLLVIHGNAKTRIRSEQQFLSRYDSIFDAHVRQAIADQSAKCLFGNYQGTMIGDGEVWYREQNDGTMKMITVNTTPAKQ